MVETIKYLNSLEDTTIDETQLHISYTSSFLYNYLTNISNYDNPKVSLL